MSKTDRSVVRNAGYRKTEFSIRERHNERKNESYLNGDIMPDRAALNVNFKTCNGTYEEEFNRMVEDGTISLRGLETNAKVFNELVFDVNTAYFDRNGGYEYAKSFFAEAYNYAVEEIGGEQYVLSAVMHADERNKAESERLGHDVFHYHLHMVYVPVVDKEVKWTKRCKDPELVGKVKEVIKQVSSSKKWPRFKDENGKWINSYSLLQDRYHDHMKAMGYTDFERGRRGSSAEHLNVLEYKATQEAKRAEKMSVVADEKQELATALDTAINSKQQTVTTLDKKAEQKKKQLDSLEKKTNFVKADAVIFSEIDRVGEKKTITGNISITPTDWKTVSNLAKEGIQSRSIITNLKSKISGFLHKIAGLEKRLETFDGKGITDNMRYYEARARAPQRMSEMIADIMRKPPEKQEHERIASQLKRSTSLDR